MKYTEQTRNNIIKSVQEHSLMMYKGTKQIMEKGQPMEVKYEEIEDRQHLGTVSQTDGC